MALLTVSATLGGAVFGDHVSPISDTTILASAGAQCDHVEHVNTQLPYAALVAAISVVAYLVGGACVGMGGVLAGMMMWVTALVLFAGAVVAIRCIQRKKN
jgi:Na+/H+ antiporter NhaC